MKKTTLLLFVIFSIVCCRKADNIRMPTDNLTSSVIEQVVQQVTTATRDALNFDSIIVTKPGYDSIYYLRIPFRNVPLTAKFVLVQYQSNLGVRAATIISITRQNAAFNGDAQSSSSLFNGKILVQNLDGEIIFQSSVKNGYVTALHPEISRKDRLSIVIHPPTEPVYQLMPEIVISAYSSTLSTWYNLQQLTGMTSGYPGTVGNTGSTTGIYTIAGGSYSSGGGATTASTSSGVVYNAYVDVPIHVDFSGQNLKVINPVDYLNCFSKVPDAGAKCYVELFTDVPVDEEPMAGFNPQTGSPGHCFLQIRKQNGAQIVAQNIGFYPASSIKTLSTTAPIPAAFGDDGRHEFNASIKMELTPAQLKAVISKFAELNNKVSYDIDDYNCTDFALEIFNFSRSGNPLEIPRMDIPGTMNPYGSHTPQGLYKQLSDMKAANHPEANNIGIQYDRGYVANSTGVCQ